MKLLFIIALVIMGIYIVASFEIILRTEKKLDMIIDYQGLNEVIAE